jgi:ABC-2 type transport system ATP-binding protein
MIVVNGLRKRFGSQTALDGMTFSVEPGQVTGFVGPNGAGKSTTMRVILGLDAPDAGTALVAGRPYRSLRRPLCHLGSLLDAGALQPGRTARNHLLWLAHSQGLSARRVDEVLERAGLQGVARRAAGGFSLGMRQRLGIAAALLGDPPALMLDEPFNGMDPEGIIWMRQHLRGLAAEGRAVLVSSHLMSELQDTDTNIAALLETAAAGRVMLRLGAPFMDAAAGVLEAAGATVSRAAEGTLTVTGLAAETVVAVLTKGGVPFAEISTHRATLEEAYLELTRDAVEFRAASGPEATR